MGWLRLVGFFEWSVIEVEKYFNLRGEESQLENDLNLKDD